MTVGSIVSLNRNEQDQSKINHAIQQLLQRNGGQQVNGSVTVSTNYSATVADFNINVPGSFEITLPLVSAAPGQMYCVKNTSSGTTVTISPSTSGQTIDGSTSQKLNVKNQTIWMQSNGTTWDVLNKNQDLSGYLQTANKLTEISTSLASTTITNLGFGSLATANTSSVLQTTKVLSELSTSAATARTNIGSAGTSQTIVGDYSGVIAFLTTAGAYDVVQSSSFSATLTSMALRLVSGTLNAKLQINGVDVGGSSVSLSSNQSAVSFSSANAMSSGATVTLVTSSPATPTNLSYTIAYSRSITLS